LFGVSLVRQPRREKEARESRARSIGFYRRLQNSKAFAGLKVGHAKMFNFSPNAYKSLNSISRGSGDSSDSNYTKYINYGCEIREKMGVVFPYPRVPGNFFLHRQALRLL
jgi:hypothetical protein